MTFIHDCFLFQITQYKIYFPPAKIGTIIEISKFFGDLFNVSHRKAPLPWAEISSFYEQKLVPLHNKMMYQGKKNIQPPFLCEGDKVALVSPAYWVPEEAILQAAEIIRGWGLVPVIGPHTTSLNVDAYAGTAD